MLINSWAIGFLSYNSGRLIHLLLVFAVIAIILKVVQGPNSFSFNKTWLLINILKIA